MVLWDTFTVMRQFLTAAFYYLPAFLLLLNLLSYSIVYKQLFTVVYFPLLCLVNLHPAVLFIAFHIA